LKKILRLAISKLGVGIGDLCAIGALAVFGLLGTMQHLREKVIMRLIGLAGYRRLLRYAKCEEGNIE